MSPKTKVPTHAVESAQSTNGGEETIALSRPYVASVTVVGVVPLLFHRWNVEAVAAKSAAAKGSKAKKTDDLESYVYRTPEGYLGIPGNYLHGALVEVGRYYPDPRSPRKALRDLCKAAIIPLTLVAPFEPKTKEWDFEDQRRVVVQRSGITRTRPAMREGWKLTFDLLVTLPEYVPPPLLLQLGTDAGRLIGLADHRPTYGRFGIANFKVRQEELNGIAQALGGSAVA